jgi:cell division topological specificity factor
VGLLDYFRSTSAAKKGSAAVAKERLQILVAHDRAARDRPSYLPRLQQEILAVIRKYVEVDGDAVSVNYEQEDSQEILELNIVLPESSARP